MAPEDITATVFTALRRGSKGWKLTAPGLASIEKKLDIAVADGTFTDCALELGSLCGFLAQKPDALPALQQLAELGLKFEVHLASSDSRREEQRYRRQTQASRRLGTPVARTAAVHDAPASKGALRLSELVSPDLLIDRRVFRPKSRG